MGTEWKRLKKKEIILSEEEMEERERDKLSEGGQDQKGVRRGEVDAWRENWH